MRKGKMNNRGFISSALLLFLAVVGIWYGHRSYTAGNLSNDLSAMLADCRRITGQVSMTATDQAVLDQAYKTIAEIAAKYKIAEPTIP